MMKCDWLDRLSFREIEMINEKQKRESNFMYLNIEFPQVAHDGHEYTVLFFEQVHCLVVCKYRFTVEFREYNQGSPKVLARLTGTSKQFV